MGRKVLKDNRGLTLVEMLVSFAILSVVMVALFQFMTMMTKQYQTSNNEVIVQNEVQTLVQQLENFIIDADLDVTLDPSSSEYELYIMGTDGFCIITYDSSAKKLYYSDYYGAASADPDYSWATYETVLDLAKAVKNNNPDVSKDLLAENVETFNVTDTSGTLTTSTNYVTIEITISKLSRSYTVNKNIYLRNQIVPSPTPTPTGAAGSTFNCSYFTVNISGPANVTGEIKLYICTTSNTYGLSSEFTTDGDGNYDEINYFSYSNISYYELYWVSIPDGYTAEDFTINITFVE